MSAAGHEMRDVVARALCRDLSDTPCGFCTAEAGLAVVALAEAGRLAAPDQISATHLTDWLHSELAGTDEPEAETAYLSVIDRVERMRARSFQTDGGAGDTPPATSAAPSNPTAQADPAIGSPTPPSPHPRRWFRLPAPPSLPRRFRLYRDQDPSGVSGTGWVAEGVVFIDGAVALRWFGEHPCTVPWDSIDRIIAVHGHGGLTEIVWLDGES